MTKQQIQDFQEKYPMEMMGLYQKYGVNKVPDVDTTIDIIRVMGDPFLMDMFNIYHREESFLGALFGVIKNKGGKSSGISEDELAYLEKKAGRKLTRAELEELQKKTGGQSVGREKGQLWNTFKSGFRDALGFAKESKEAITGIRDGSGGAPDAGSRGSGDGKIAGMSKGLFFGLVAAVLIIVVVVIINVRKG